MVFDVAKTRALFPALQQPVLMPDGSSRPPVFLNNGASCLMLGSVGEALATMPEYYGVFGRGGGPQQARVSFLMDQFSRRMLQFVGADPFYYTVGTAENATHALNILIHGMDLQRGDVVVDTIFSHNSLDNPFRLSPAKVITVGMGKNDTRLDLDRLLDVIQKAGPKLKAVGLTYASNLTGAMLPIYTIATAAHRANPLAKVLVDVAQTFAHIPINMGSNGDIDQIDMIAGCGHKAYTGQLGNGFYVAPTDFLSHARPLVLGGGTVAFVSQSTGIDFIDSPARMSAGTRNVIGAVALMIAMDFIEQHGLRDGSLLEHEVGLKRHFYELAEKSSSPIASQLFEYARPDRFNETLGNILLLGGTEDQESLLANWAIESRSGASCAPLLALDLLHVKKRDLTYFRDMGVFNHAACGRVFRLLRLTPAAYTTMEEIEFTYDVLSNPIRHQTYSYARFEESHSTMLQRLGITPPTLQDLTESIIHSSFDDSDILISQVQKDIVELGKQLRINCDNEKAKGLLQKFGMQPRHLVRSLAVVQSLIQEGYPPIRKFDGIEDYLVFLKELCAVMPFEANPMPYETERAQKVIKIIGY